MSNSESQSVLVKVESLTQKDNQLPKSGRDVSKLTLCVSMLGRSRDIDRLKDEIHQIVGRPHIHIYDVETVSEGLASLLDP